MTCLSCISNHTRAVPIMLVPELGEAVIKITKQVVVVENGGMRIEFWADGETFVFTRGHSASSLVQPPNEGRVTIGGAISLLLSDFTSSPAPSESLREKKRE